jgi:hypothetical protein
MATPALIGTVSSTSFTTERVGDGGNNITLPAGITTGELLCIDVAFENDATASTISGWTRVVNTNTANYTNVAMYRRTADETEGSTVNISFGDNNRVAIAHAYRLDGVDTAQAGVYETANGSNDPANPPSVAWGWAGDTQTFALTAVDDATVSGLPSGYTQLFKANNGKARVGAWFKTTAPTSSPENPGTVSIGSNRRWWGVTWAVKGTGGAAAQTITGASYTNTSTFGTGAIVAGAIAITGAAFTNTSTFGAGTVSQTAPAQTITGAQYTNPNSFGTGSIAVGAVSIAGASFTHANSFGTGTISQSGGTQTITGAPYTNVSTFGAGTITAGAVTITGASYANGNTFGTGSVSGSYTVTGASFTNTSTFGTGSFSTAYTITGAAYVNPNAFGTGSLSVGAATRGISIYASDTWHLTTPFVLVAGVWLEPVGAWTYEGGVWLNAQRD